MFSIRSETPEVDHWKGWEEALIPSQHMFERNNLAYEVCTSNFKELSRYILEDLLTVRERGRPTLLCISEDLNGVFKNYLLDTAE